MLTWQKAISVRTPVISAISFILIVGFLTTNLVSYYVSKESLRRSLIDNELPLTSNNIYSEIQRDLLQPVFVSSLMANDTFVSDWLESGEQNPDKAIRYLDRIREKYDFFTSFLVSERTKNYYHFSGLTQVVSENDPRDAWYFRIRDMEAAHEINVDPNPEQGDILTIYINHRVMDHEGQFIAATGVGLKFDSVANIVARYRENFGRNVFFVDDRGKIMVHSDEALSANGNINSTTGISVIAEDLLTSSAGHYEYVLNGDTMLVSSRYIPELNWWVVVEQRQDEALAEIKRSLLTNSAVGLVVIGLTLVLVTLTLNFFHARLEDMATKDKLTNIGNRSVFDLALSHALRLFKRDGRPFSVILLDIDHFKRINDMFGHLRGDQVIQEIARITGETIRETDILCRWGGEEFIVLAYECTAADAAVLAEKIRATIENASIADIPHDHPVTVSIGYTEVRSDDSEDDLLKRSDNALYQAKENGRNQIAAGQT